MRRSFLAVTAALTMFVALVPAWQAPDSGPYKVIKKARSAERVAGTTSMLTPMDAGCTFREATRAVAATDNARGAGSPGTVVDL